ncbi:proteinrelated to small s protein [Metarhizium guizhouense ARSEF 977]|uniref:Proteinrelated to small s protein n=1 Tax=Metarhizium guizhouense (strain ARSEF 977) TaxID=1276136 RepID=A0A0B4GZQ2_METGA|nr:proteinrelated to small s protein [Metarhizium guizhouense ARSEF 977]
MTAAFKTLANDIRLPLYYCFFIDGLDEHTVNYLGGITPVRRLIRKPWMKILVSSRPIPACVDAFSPVPKLKLQDLTKADAESYAQDTVGSYPYMADLVASDPTSSDAILQQLIEKAAGVFLWVVLACRSLINGFTAYDHIKELTRRADELLPNLDDLFRRVLGVLGRVESRYHEHMAKMLRICYQRQITGGRRDETATIYTIAIFDSHGFNFDSNDQLKKLTRPQQFAACVPMEG